MARDYDQWRAEGIVPIVRKVEGQSADVVSAMQDILAVSSLGQIINLRSELGGVPLTYYNLFSTYNNDLAVPKTTEIIESIPELKQPVDVQISHIGLFGDARRPKIAAVLDSPELKSEFEAVKSAYAKHMIWLRPDQKRGGDDYLPLYTLADVAPRNEGFVHKQLRRINNHPRSRVILQHMLLSLEPAIAD